MPRFEGTFEIDSKTDSHAARKILEQAYDTVREESRSVRAGTADATELLRQFETLKQEAKQSAPGRLTIVYERDADEFDD